MIDIGYQLAGLASLTVGIVTGLVIRQAVARMDQRRERNR